MSELFDIARRAYVYGAPTVALHRVLTDLALDRRSPLFRAPLNDVGHNRRVADPRDLTIADLDADTVHSYAWLDLRAEPVVLTLPPFGYERYMAAHVVDLYGYIVASVSPRTGGHRGATVAVAGPSWHGPTPAGARLLRVPTELCLVAVRTQLLDGDDLPVAAALQDQIRLRALSSWTSLRRRPAPAAPPAPTRTVNLRRSPTPQFLRVLDRMLAYMPVLPGEESLRRELGFIGLGSGILDDLLADPHAHADLVEGLRAGRHDVLRRVRTVHSSGEVFGSRAFFAGDHLSRAAGAFLGTLENAAEEYLRITSRDDGDGRPLDGAHDYRIRFAPGGLPPVEGFWSLTVHGEDRRPYGDPPRVLTSRQVSTMRRDADGGVTVLVQRRPPPRGSEANWLPCPAAPFELAFRAYLPGPALRAGRWTLPPVFPDHPAAAA